MRGIFTTLFSLILWSAATCIAADPASTPGEDHPHWSSVVALLRDASDIAQQQRDDQQFWTERVLLDIGNVQIRARDFESAERSIRASSYDYGRESGLIELAKALARNGQRDRAQEVLQLLNEDRERAPNVLLVREAEVQLQWIEYLIAVNEFGRAEEAIEQLRTDTYRASGLLSLATGCVEAGDKTRASRIFDRTVKVADQLPDEFSRAASLWKTSDAQLTAEMVDAAKATLRTLTAKTDYTDASAKVAAEREAGALAFRLEETAYARDLFTSAVRSCNSLNANNKFHAISSIAVAQATSGDIPGALRTAALITRSDSDATQIGGHDAALYAVVVAQLATNDVEGALRTTGEIADYIQYRDDAFQQIAEYHFQNREYAKALAALDKIDNSSMKAAGKLKIATAYAKADDHAAATKTAARIQLAPHPNFDLEGMNHRFDSRSPKTWGVRYEPGFTMASMHRSDSEAANVAAAAMKLALELGQKPSLPYEELFKDFNPDQVIRKLARTHAASGDVDEALAWARRIGSDRPAQKEDSASVWAAERRIHALVGAAEGILDRDNDVK